MNHGITISENSTPIRAMNQTENIVVAIGTAPIPNTKPVLAYTYAEAVQQLGYSEGYTLCEVMEAQFNLYGMAPAAFINVFNPEKHFIEEEKTFEGVTIFNLEGDLIAESLEVTSGEFEEPITLIAGTDYVCDSMYLHGQDNDPVVGIEFLSTAKIKNNKFKVSYRTTHTALGGEPTVEEVTLEELEDNIYELTDDTVIESVVVTTGGVNTLVNLDFTINNSGGVAQVSIVLGAPIVDDKIKVKYKLADPSKVTAEDIIGGIDAATGQKFGLQLVDDIYPKWNLVAGVLIAPGFSTDIAVATALARKAKSISDVFSGVAIADIPCDLCKTYSQAVEYKNENNLADTHLILTYPKVLAEGKQYFLSTHLAALINRVDYENNNIPFVSPSNQALEISASILADGTEIFLNQSAANFLNANGVGTVFSFGGSLKFWGNYISIYPSSNDVKDIFISVRRMFNFIKTQLLNNYISNLDVPITKRNIDAILQSCNLYLASLTSRQALLGGRVEFNEAANTTADLMAGRVNFDVYICPPVPAQEMNFTLTYDADYYSTLFA